jgi:hypothetical protein
MASFLGLGSDNVYLIHCNSKGKMNVQHLEQEIQRALEEGAVPFMVSATAGETNNEIMNCRAILRRDKKNTLSIQRRQVKKINQHAQTRRITWAGHAVHMENNRLLAQLKKRDYFGALGTDRNLFLKCLLQVCDMNFIELT